MTEYMFSAPDYNAETSTIDFVVELTDEELLVVRKLNAFYRFKGFEELIRVQTIENFHKTEARFAAKREAYREKYPPSVLDSIVKEIYENAVFKQLQNDPLIKRLAGQSKMSKYWINLDVIKPEVEDDPCS